MLNRIATASHCPEIGHCGAPICEPSPSRSAVQPLADFFGTTIPTIASRQLQPSHAHKCPLAKEHLPYGLTTTGRRHFSVDTSEHSPPLEVSTLGESGAISQLPSCVMGAQMSGAREKYARGLFRVTFDTREIAKHGRSGLFCDPWVSRSEGRGPSSTTSAEPEASCAFPKSPAARSSISSILRVSSFLNVGVIKSMSDRYFHFLPSNWVKTG